MTKTFEWNDSFSVANEEIDRQHKMLFDLANSIREELNQQRIKRIIMDLYKYTREHFADEEQMMQKIDYPLFEAHKKLHEDLITKLNTICAQPFENDESVNNFVDFVYDWLTHHILNKDMEYRWFAQSKVVE